MEYAIEAINNAGSAVGILAKTGIIIAGTVFHVVPVFWYSALLVAEKKVVSKLLAPAKNSGKTLRLDDHLICAVAGTTNRQSKLTQSDTLQV